VIAEVPLIVYLSEHNVIAQGESPHHMQQSPFYICMCGVLRSHNVGVSRSNRLFKFH